jgi:hypothetical protein
MMVPLEAAMLQMDSGVYGMQSAGTAAFEQRPSAMLQLCQQHPQAFLTTSDHPNFQSPQGLPTDSPIESTATNDSNTSPTTADPDELKKRLLNLESPQLLREALRCWENQLPIRVGDPEWFRIASSGLQVRTFTAHVG